VGVAGQLHSFYLLLGMSFRTLDNWVRIGLVTCSQVADGTGTRRAWTVDDVTIVAFLQSLRKNGVSTQQLNSPLTGSANG